MTIAAKVPPNDETGVDLPPSAVEESSLNPAGNAVELYSTAAKRILQERLEGVWQLAGPAVESWRHDPEHIHRLRVATRRANAALKAFADLLPAKRAKRLRGELSSLRRAAGDARDLDVLALRLRKKPPKGLSKATRKALKLIARHRTAAQAHCDTTYASLQGDDFPAHVESLLRRVRWRGPGVEPAFPQAVQHLLDATAADMAVALESELPNGKALHQLRIQVKQMRYTLELLDDEQASAAQLTFLKELKCLQDRLGKLNDRDAARTRFQGWAAKAARPKTQRRLLKLAGREKRKLKSKTRKFHAWWNAQGRERFQSHLQQATATRC